MFLSLATDKPKMLAVIDDDPAVLRAIGRLLRAEGYRVSAYTCGEEFLGSLRKARPRCVVMDLNMPKVSGYDLLATLSREAAQIPVIVVTADQDPALAARLRKLGARVCLRKPIDEGALLEQVRLHFHDGASARSR